MRHPSIRVRLMLGTGLVVAIVLIAANIAIYRAFERTLWKEVDRQLSQSASLLGKSAELEAHSVGYEWQEAMKNPALPEITGIFQFWDLKTGNSTKSPDLAGDELPMFHGELDETVHKDITFRNGRHARAIGLLHLPFSDQEAIDKAASEGVILKPSDHPQVLVCARETETLVKRLSRLRAHLIRAAAGTLTAIWGSIFVISFWCMRPLKQFNDNLLTHSEKEDPPAIEVPENLPSELLGLAHTFNTTLHRMEQSRAREKEFALNAAHELRTPLAGILATLEQAVYRPRPIDELTARIQDAIHISTGMRSTLDSLMRMARLRGGLEKATNAAINPGEVADELLRSRQEQAIARRLTIRTHFPNETKILVTDAGLFQALLSNLIDNAVAHSPAGDTVDFDILETKAHFIFASHNNAGSLTPGILDQLFEAFQRGTPSAYTSDRHAGLGLSLSREAARILGGRIEAAIEPPGIISFTVTIPYRVPVSGM